jgi:hypothetical protein
VLAFVVDKVLLAREGAAAVLAEQTHLLALGAVRAPAVRVELGATDEALRTLGTRDGEVVRVLGDGVAAQVLDAHPARTAFAGAALLVRVQRAAVCAQRLLTVKRLVADGASHQLGVLHHDVGVQLRHPLPAMPTLPANTTTHRRRQCHRLQIFSSHALLFQFDPEKGHFSVYQNGGVAEHSVCKGR